MDKYPENEAFLLDQMQFCRWEANRYLFTRPLTTGTVLAAVCQPGVDYGFSLVLVPVSQQAEEIVKAADVNGVFAAANTSEMLRGLFRLFMGTPELSGAIDAVVRNLYAEH